MRKKSCSASSIPDNPSIQFAEDNGPFRMALLLGPRNFWRVYE